MAPKRRSTRILDTPSPPPPPMRPLQPAPPGMKWNTLTGGLMLDQSHRDHVARFRAAFPGEIDIGAYAESTRHVPPNAPAEYDQTHLLDIARRQQERDASISEESEEEEEDEVDVSEDFVSAREQQNDEVQPMGSKSPSLEEQDVPMDDVELGDEQEDADVDDDDEDDGGDDVEDEDVSMEDADEQYEDRDEVQQEEDEESEPEPEPEPEPMTRAERAIAWKRANRTSLREKVTAKKYKERESD